MIKLIVTDIDGTLVKDGTLDINPEYMDVIKKLTEKGIHFVACSGRQYCSERQLFVPVKDRIIFYFGWRYSDPYIGGNIKSSYIVC